MVDGFYAQFVHVVGQGRNLPEERVRELADGRIYTGLEARALGLVDVVGHLDDAIAAAKDLACIKDAKLVAYDRCNGQRGSIYAGVQIPSEVNIKLQVPGLSGTPGAAFMYLWQP